jgi:tight adherence protein B
MLILVMFLAIFATAALLLLVISSASGAKTKQQTLSRLDAIRMGPQSPLTDEEPVEIRRQDNLSNIEWLDKLLQQVDLAPKLQLLLYQAGMNWTIGRLLISSLVGALVASYLVYLRTHAVLLTLMFAALGGFLPFGYVLRMRSKRFYKMKERLSEALDLMVSAIRAGHSFSSAMGMAAKDSPEPVRREFKACFDEQNFGLELRVAMTNMAYRMPLKEIRMITAAVLIQKETGGNLTEILEKTSMLIREDFRFQRQVRVHTAQGRLTGWILAILPMILGVMLYLVNPEQMSLLWRHETGLMMTEFSGVMMVIGTLIIRRIVRIEI